MESNHHKSLKFYCFHPMLAKWTFNRNTRLNHFVWLRLTFGVTSGKACYNMSKNFYFLFD